MEYRMLTDALPQKVYHILPAEQAATICHLEEVVISCRKTLTRRAKTMVINHQVAYRTATLEK